tara:strand:- start:630 stop:893 length:264 start_codon:yes stop_codon:yes gene_type:complete
MYKDWINRTSTLHNADGTKTTTQGPIDWEEIKQWRSLVLKDCDWWGLKDLTMSQKKKDFRQFLRDLPQNFSDADEAYAAIMAYDEPE